MNDKNKYSQNDRVYFTIGEKPGRVIEGWGKVCGKTGPIWILELEKSIDDYPFTHVQIMDAQIRINVEES